MSTKEKLQQILADRAKQEAEEARRRNEAEELYRVRLQAEEARKNAEMQRVKGILDSKGIPQMLEQDVLPFLGSWVTLWGVTEENIIVHQGGRPAEHTQAIGVVISGRVFPYDNAKLGVFVSTGPQMLHICTGNALLAENQLSLNDRHLKDKVESLLAAILSEPKRFCWDDPGDYSTDFG